MMAEQKVQLTQQGELHFLILNDPPANRTDFQFFKELGQAVTCLQGVETLQGVILHGIGRHFSSGADVEQLKAQLWKGNSDQTGKIMEYSSRIVDKLACLPCPVVAAIRGCCIGSGMELALACDFRVAAENAYFSMPEITFGLIPGCGGTCRLPRLAGLGRSIELLLTGESLLADRALKMGIIDRIVPKDSLLDAAEDMLRAFPEKRRAEALEGTGP